MDEASILLNDLWHEVHGCMRPFLEEEFHSDEVGSAVAALRRAYRAMNENGKPPNFDDRAHRAAYAIAYHPAHAYAYLHLLVRRKVGDFLFDGVTGGLSVLVLGAGCGAETLAMVHYLAQLKPGILSESSFHLIDRADWGEMRESALREPVNGLALGFSSNISEATIDLATFSGLQILSEVVPRYDLILCPALFTELISQEADFDLARVLVRSMEVGKRLVVIDQRFVNQFNRKKHDWFQSRDMKILNSGEMAYKALEIPRPPAWAMAQIFGDSLDNRIPARHYSLSWLVMQRG